MAGKTRWPKWIGQNWIGQSRPQPSRMCREATNVLLRDLGVDQTHNNKTHSWSSQDLWETTETLPPHMGSSETSCFRGWRLEAVTSSQWCCAPKPFDRLLQSFPIPNLLKPRLWVEQTDHPTRNLLPRTWTKTWVLINPLDAVGSGEEGSLWKSTAGIAGARVAIRPILGVPNANDNRRRHI